MTRFPALAAAYAKRAATYRTTIGCEHALRMLKAAYDRSGAYGSERDAYIEAVSAIQERNVCLRVEERAAAEPFDIGAPRRPCPYNRFDIGAPRR